MTGFHIARFTGEHPLLQGRKMPEGAARSAFDCDLTGTDLRAFRALGAVGNISSASLSNKSAFVYNANQMFVFIGDIDATFGPLQAEDEFKDKVFISAGFQAWPVYSTKEIGFPNPSGTYRGAPIAWRRLGVPPAPTKALVTIGEAPNGGISQIQVETIDDVDRMVLYMSNHGLDDGDRIRITGFATGWEAVADQVYTITLIDEHKVYLNNFDTEPYADLGAGGVGAWEQEWNNEDLEDRVYLWTLVTDQGEEGPPSDPSDLVTLGPDQSVTVTTPTSAVVDDAIVEFKRIYRTIPTSSGEADYFFVAEIPVSQPDFVDTLAVVQLGERIPSIDWDMPPENLKGLVALPNGVLAGFFGRTLCLSEPYQPHAWPAKYQKTMEHEIVAIAAFGQSLVVATDENPQIGTATDPLSMTLTKLDSVEPCIAKRACRSIGYGVIYPSPNGLILVGPGGTRNVTRGIWDERDWRALFDDHGEAFAEVHDGRYYLMWDDLGIVFDPTSESLEISRLTVSQTYGLAVDRDEDRLFLLARDGVAAVREWNPDDQSSRIETTWRSQTFVMPYPVNMGAFQLFYDTADGGTHEIEFFADGVSKYTAAVSSQEPQRLPSGFLAREWAVEVRTTGSVQALYVAETISELRGALSR